MKVVDAPPAATPDSQAPPKPGSDTGRWALLLTAVALALAWLAYKTITRPSRGSDSDAAVCRRRRKAVDKPAEHAAVGRRPPTRQALHLIRWTRGRR